MLANRIRGSVYRKKEQGNYVMATDDDFSGTRNGEFRYIGKESEIEIPSVIKGTQINSYLSMFRQAPVGMKRVVSKNPGILNTRLMFVRHTSDSLDLKGLDISKATDLSMMFYQSNIAKLELSQLDTSSAEDMSNMFRQSGTNSLDLTSFDTSNVRNMSNMFEEAAATSINTSSFDTRNVTSMRFMFYGVNITTLDLSSFQLRDGVDITGIFRASQIKTVYARTQKEADKFNSSSEKPLELTAIVKP